MSIKHESRLLRLWTVQPLAVWEQIQRDGLVFVDESHASYGGYVPPAYRWLAEQLTQRVPGYQGRIPWWAYGEKPDLRWVRHTRPAGQIEVRLELEPAPETFVIFPCWAWNDIYTGNYLAYTQPEHDSWMARMREAVPDEDVWPLPEPWKTELEASWQRLFDPSLPILDWDPESSRSRHPCREAVLEALWMADVREVTLFRGTHRRVRR